MKDSTSNTPESVDNIGSFYEYISRCPQAERNQEIQTFINNPNNESSFLGMTNDKHFSELIGGYPAAQKWVSKVENLSKLLSLNMAESLTIIALRKKDFYSYTKLMEKITDWFIANMNTFIRKKMNLLVRYLTNNRLDAVSLTASDSNHSTLNNEGISYSVSDILANNHTSPVLPEDPHSLASLLEKSGKDILPQIDKSIITCELLDILRDGGLDSILSLTLFHASSLIYQQWYTESNFKTLINRGMEESLFHLCINFKSTFHNDQSKTYCIPWMTRDTLDQVFNSSCGDKLMAECLKHTTESTIKSWINPDLIYKMINKKFDKTLLYIIDLVASNDLLTAEIKKNILSSPHLPFTQTWIKSESLF